MALATRGDTTKTLTDFATLRLKAQCLVIQHWALFFLDRPVTVRSSVFHSGIAFAASLTNQKSGCLVRANETWAISGLYEKATDRAV